MVTIVDFGLGNLGSIVNIIRRIGGESRVSGSPELIAEAEKLVLPGVGSFDKGMGNLKSRGLLEPLEKAVLERKTPILGICLGMQLLGKSSEEGELPGLGWINGRCVKFSFEDASLKVPHMGWNEVAASPSSRLFGGLGSCADRFYFVHSYHMICESGDDVAARCFYGREFTAAVERENIFGVQFHPEKSHRHGMALFKRFLEL